MRGIVALVVGIAVGVSGCNDAKTKRAVASGAADSVRLADSVALEGDCSAIQDVLEPALKTTVEKRHGRVPDRILSTVRNGCRLRAGGVMKGDAPVSDLWMAFKSKGWEQGEVHPTGNPEDVVFAIQREKTRCVVEVDWRAA